MKVGLMVPCYVDMFYPEVGIATVELLEKLKIDFEYPHDQTCCGQPTANSGCYEEAKATEELFIQLFHGYDYIIAPSGSCTRAVPKVFDTKSALETRPGGISPPLAENDKTSIPEGCRRRHQKDDKTHCELLRDYPREYIARRPHDRHSRKGHQDRQRPDVPEWRPACKLSFS